MTSNKIHTATCMCGDISLEAKGATEYVEYCHCKTCQQSAGSSYIVWCIFDRDKVAITQGEMSYYNSSDRLKRGFCGNCGSTMTVLTEECHDIALGVMDNPNDFEITQHIWIKRALDHVKLDDDLPKYDEDGPL